MEINKHVSQSHNLIKENMMHISPFLAGSIAGACGIFMGHPFDTLKVRMQVGNNLDYKKIDIHLIKQLYRGLLSPLLSAGTIASINFSLYENFRRNLKGNITGEYKNVFVSGSLAGAFVSVLSTPIGFIKLQQQIQTEKGLLNCISVIYKQYGIKIFYRGFFPMFYMDTIGRGVYMSIYEASKNNLAQLSNLMPHDMSIRVASAAIAGVFSWLSIYPFDVIKSHIQYDIQKAKYRSTLDCARAIVTTSGYRGLFRGIGYTIIRAAPVAAVVLPAYEFAKHMIENEIQKF